MMIDAHQHFWVFDPTKYPWINDELRKLRRDFLPADLERELAATKLDSSIAVQARQTLEESRWLLTLADHSPSVKGVVGWVDLQSDRVDEQLVELTKHSKFVGVRHVVQDEADDEFMLRPDFLRGLGGLKQFNLTYDLLTFPKHLRVARKVVERFPEQKFVLDHISKPFIRAGTISPWDRDIRELAKCKNVWCKVSGMVTEANWNQWKQSDFRPYLDVVFEAFGEDRLMFGSDWPVCLVAGRYEDVLGIVRDYIQPLPETSRQKILGTNAARFYGVTPVSQ
ncbi:MAG: amidohydrolase family protein [Verrucomicrobiota bacterium]